MTVRYGKIFWLVILTAGIASAALGFVSAWAKVAVNSSSNPPVIRNRAPSHDSKSAAAALSAGNASEHVEVEEVTITPNGLQPKEITRPEGAFVLSVNNRSGLRCVNLRLDHRTDDLLGIVARLHDVAVPGEQLDWNSEVLRLRPGHYVLTEAAHLQWSCHITITPQ